jgi:secreted trypsin-like serine protease
MYAWADTFDTPSLSLPHHTKRFPFQVAVGGIGSSSSPGQFCGGTLVETDSIPVVVTAAHCIGSTDTAKNVGVVLGGYGLWTDKKDLGGGTLYKLKVCGG